MQIYHIYDPAIPLLIFTREGEGYPYKDLNMNIYSSFIYVIETLETTPNVLQRENEEANCDKNHAMKYT